jgi:putative transposase
MKVRFFPTPIQKTFLRRCLGTTRKLYNETVAYINDEYESQKHLEKRTVSSFYSVRKEIIVSNADLDDSNRWLSDVPYNTRQLAVKAAIDARTTCFGLLKAKRIDHFKLSFKSRKDVCQICYFDASSLSLSKTGGLQLCKTGFLKGNSLIRVSKRGEKDVKAYFNGERSDYTVKLDGEAFYLCLSTITPREEAVEAPLEKKQVVALDPGVRTFMTGYSPSGEVIQTTDEVSTRLKGIFKQIDDVNTSTTKAKGRSKKRHRLKMRRLHRKIKDVVNNMHIHVSKELAKAYGTIIIPDFGTSKMLKERTLNSSAKRMMSSLAFYRFKERLYRTCTKFKTECKVVTEEYTSKTCTSCGHLHENLGGNKTYNCVSCKLSIDRDINGARNILLKHI